jgi:polar amino acid transport system substrate-binding protein
MMVKMKFLLALLLFVIPLSLNAATFKIFAAEVPALLEKKGEGVAGFTGVFGKIVADKIIKAGKAEDFEVAWVPWKRALFETGKAKNGVFFPLARTPEREKEFVWLGRLGAVESWFYTTNPKIKITTLDDLKKYRIGFMSGSMREAELRKVFGDKTQNLEGLTEDLENYRKLIYGRIDIWATQTEVFDEAEKDYKAKNATPPKIYHLKKFLDQDIWIVGGASMEEKYQEQIRAIFDTKKKDSEQKKVSSLPLLGANNP